jgi:hypothetical protein
MTRRSAASCVSGVCARCRDRTVRGEDRMEGSIVEQFRAAPPGTLYGVHGDSSVFRLALIAAGYTLLQGVPVTLVDGSNRFDLYGLAEFARRTAGGRCTPDELLRNIFISRAFTCYQMEAVIAERLQAFVRGRGSTVVLIFGMLDTFYDEQAPLRDVHLGVRRMMQALQGLKRDGVSVLVASTDVGPVPPARRGLLPGVMKGMDRVFDMRTAVKKEELRAKKEERRTGGTYERLAAAG